MISGIRLYENQNRNLKLKTNTNWQNCSFGNSIKMPNSNVSKGTNTLPKNLARLGIGLIKLPFLIIIGAFSLIVGAGKIIKLAFEKDEVPQPKPEVKKEPIVPEFTVNLPRDAKLNISEFGYPTVPEGAEYATKLDFKLPENSKITYPDGTVKDLNKVLAEEGINTHSGGCYQYFVKDKEGNVFRKTAEIYGYNYYDVKAHNDIGDIYYALSDKNELYSIDLSKLPPEQEFEFCTKAIDKQIMVPNGTVIEYDDKKIVVDGDMRNLICYYTNKSKPELRLAALDRKNAEWRFVDKVSKERGDFDYKKAVEAEQALIKKFEEENPLDDIPTTNMCVNTTYISKGLGSDWGEAKNKPEELDFCKLAYKYYVDKNSEYKDCQFLFHVENGSIRMTIEKDDKEIEKIYGSSKLIDGPVFEDSRYLMKLGEFEKIVPRKINT